jgi:hypothetical protein
MKQKFLIDTAEQEMLRAGGELTLRLAGQEYLIGFDVNGRGPRAERRVAAGRDRLGRRRPKTITCKRCPNHPVFRTHSAFMKHRRATHRQKANNVHTAK